MNDDPIGVPPSEKLRAPSSIQKSTTALSTLPHTADELPSARLYDVCIVGFVTVLIASNLLGPAKVVIIVGIPLSIGNVFFPVSYVFSDVLTEVYGYRRARRAIWLGFGALLITMLMSLVVVNFPIADSESNNHKLQPALEIVFGQTSRIIIASISAFWFGDFANAYVLSRMKLLTDGRYLWSRTIGSTVVGQAVDSALFYPTAFLGVLTPSTVAMLIVTNWIFKVTIEVFMTPVTYVVVKFLKKREGVDVFDYGVNYSPFVWRR